MSKTTRHFRNTWYPALAGFAGISLGTGLLRFAYTPIIPSLIHADWTTVPEAAWLGSANFWGGLIGMLIALPASRWIPRQRLLNAAMLLGVLSLFACAWDLGLIWFGTWRFLQGFLGALIMAIVPGGVMAFAPESQRRLVGGITIAGMGFALMPCLIFPSINQYGPTGEWLLCAMLGLACFAVTGPFAIRHIRGTAESSGDAAALTPSNRKPYFLFVAAYAVAGVSMIPDALFLSDYLVRSLGASPAQASALFAWFAGGLAVGAVSGGVIAHRFGTLLSIAILAILGLTGNSFILFTQSPNLASIASFFFSLWVGGTVSMASIRTLELVGPTAHVTFWPIMCLAYAIGMGIAATGFAFLLDQGADYRLFFWLVEALMLLFIAFAISSYRWIEKQSNILH